MAYMIYSIAVLSLILVTVAYFSRPYWHSAIGMLDIPLPFSGAAREYLYASLPQTFAGDVEAGLSSNTFDLAGNVEGGDSRAGLDDAAKAEILRIMKKRRLRFDEARRVYMENRFSANGIGPDGLPRDPKFVSFS